MATYPTNIYEGRTVENLPGIVYDPNDLKTLFAEDINNLNNEVEAVETELGTNPSGDFDTVAERLDDIEENMPVSDILTVIKTITSAQIKALYASPVELIPAPGAGKYIIIESVVVFFNYGTIAYLSGGNISITNSGGGISFVSSVLTTTYLRGMTSVITRKTPPETYFGQSSLVNIGCYLKNISASEYTNGDGTIKLIINYRVITG